MIKLKNIDLLLLLIPLFFYVSADGNDMQALKITVILGAVSFFNYLSKRKAGKEFKGTKKLPAFAAYFLVLYILVWFPNRELDWIINSDFLAIVSLIVSALVVFLFKASTKFTSIAVIVFWAFLIIEVYAFGTQINQVYTLEGVQNILTPIGTFMILLITITASGVYKEMISLFRRRKTKVLKVKRRKPTKIPKGDKKKTAFRKNYFSKINRNLRNYLNK